MRGDDDCTSLHGLSLPNWRHVMCVHWPSPAFPTWPSNKEGTRTWILAALANLDHLLLRVRQARNNAH